MNIKSIIYSIIYISIIGVLIELFVPQSKMKKYTTMLMVLLVIITLLSPLVSLLENDTISQAIAKAIQTISVNTVNEKSNR